MVDGMVDQCKSCACSPSLPQWEGKNVWLGFDKLMGNIGASDAKGVKCMWAQTPPVRHLTRWLIA
jgi:hypothetical protein